MPKLFRTLSFSLLAAFLTVSPASFAAEEKDSVETVKGAVTVDAAKAKELFDKGAVFIDTRKDSDWDAGRIPGAIHMELKSVFNETAMAEKVKTKETPVVFYCNGVKCLRSSEASVMAVGWGYKNVYYFRLGFPAWKEAGNPSE